MSTQHGTRPRSVLHICADLARQSLYSRMFKAIAAQGIGQSVYAAVRSEQEQGWQSEELDGIPVQVRRILLRRHRILFRSKIRSVAADIDRCYRLDQIGMIHAHFLYSDGAAAIALSEKYALPMIVAVRNTDVNFFMRYRPDLAGVRDRVLEHAKHIIFLNDAYRDRLTRILPSKLSSLVQKKARVIPNGLNPEWFETAVSPPLEALPLRLLYVGDFSPNKNLSRLLHAVRRLRESQPVTLTLVGGGGKGSHNIENLLASDQYTFATCLGKIDDPHELRKLYREHHIVVMPSINETFGMVYIEALSQGVPVVHSHGQGIDGYFQASTVAEAVNPLSVSSIADGILRLQQRQSAVKMQCLVESSRFSWATIAKQYVELYESALGGATK